MAEFEGRPHSTRKPQTGQVEREDCEEGHAGIHYLQDLNLKAVASSFSEKKHILGKRVSFGGLIHYVFGTHIGQCQVLKTMVILNAPALIFELCNALDGFALIL